MWCVSVVNTRDLNPDVSLWQRSGRLLGNHPSGLPLTHWYSMTKRLTEHPFRVRFTVTETAANTFTRVDIPLPVAALSGGDKAQAIELMAIFSVVDEPDHEDDQFNRTQFEVTKDAVANQPAVINNQNFIYGRNISFRSQLTVSGKSSELFELTKYQDMTDHDGMGELILERTIHAAMVGTGNAAAKAAAGWLLCHLVELDTSDVISAVLESD